MGARAAPSTPPPTWRLGLSPPTLGGASEVSVRKLCAELWETEHFRPPAHQPRCRRRNSDVESPCHHQPPSRGSSLRRQIESTTDDHRLVQRHADLLQPITPSTSTNHSLEVLKRKAAFSQTGSSLAKSASYGFGSSTKLLKVLNRIWSLEEQNTANTSLVKALKMELDECRAEIKEVQHRKKKEEEEDVKDVLRSMKRELDKEREVRMKSESMHRKVTRELCEAKHCLSKALKDVEKERKERVVLEDLCDEFAKAVVKDKSPVSDKVIVEIAEVWTDQRLQMKDHKEDRDKRKSHSSDFRTKPDDSAAYMHQRVCLKELEEGLRRRSRRDNKLQLKSSDQVRNLSMSSQGDKIHPEIATPRNVDDYEQCRASSKIVMVREERRSLKDKLMEARVESRRLKSTPVQA